MQIIQISAPLLSSINLELDYRGHKARFAVFYCRIIFLAQIVMASLVIFVDSGAVLSGWPNYMWCL